MQNQSKGVHVHQSSPGDFDIDRCSDNHSCRSTDAVEESRDQLRHAKCRLLALNRLVKEGFFEKLFGSGIRAEIDRKSKMAFR